MTTALTRLSGSAFELTVTVPWADVKKVYDEVFDQLAAEIEIEGFRKGKAPPNIVKSKIDQGKVYGEVINRVLPEYYSRALKDHGLNPIISPKVSITSAEEDKEWQFIIRAAEKPAVELNDYQESIQGLNAKGKIWTPDSGEDKDKKSAEDQTEEKSKRVSEIIDKLLETCRVELAEILVESETSRLVSQLVDDVRRAGLTIEQYLASTQQTSEQLQERFRKQAETALKLEFILEAVADDLGVKISEEELRAVIDKETNPEKRKSLEAQSYLLAQVMRREQTLTRLSNL